MIDEIKIRQSHIHDTIRAIEELNSILTANSSPVARYLDFPPCQDWFEDLEKIRKSLDQYSRMTPKLDTSVARPFQRG